MMPVFVLALEAAVIAAAALAVAIGMAIAVAEDDDVPGWIWAALLVILLAGTIVAGAGASEAWEARHLEQPSHLERMP